MTVVTSRAGPTTRNTYRTPRGARFGCMTIAEVESSLKPWVFGNSGTVYPSQEKAHDPTLTRVTFGISFVGADRSCLSDQKSGLAGVRDQPESAANGAVAEDDPAVDQDGHLEPSLRRPQGLVPSH
jgi:hypothetical protein